MPSKRLLFSSSRRSTSHSLISFHHDDKGELRWYTFTMFKCWRGGSTREPSTLRSTFIGLDWTRLAARRGCACRIVLKKSVHTERGLSVVMVFVSWLPLCLERLLWLVSDVNQDLVEYSSGFFRRRENLYWAVKRKRKGNISRFRRVGNDLAQQIWPLERKREMLGWA